MRIVRAAEVAVSAADPAKWTSQVWRADILRADSGGLRSNRFVYAAGGTVWQGPVDDSGYRSALPADVRAR